jgi:hypothetical protein
VGDVSVEVPALTAILQFKKLVGRAEEYFDAPALAVNADNVFIGKAEVRREQGQPVFLVLVAHEDELGLDAVFEFDLRLARIFALPLRFRIWL